MSDENRISPIKIVLMLTIVLFVSVAGLFFYLRYEQNQVVNQDVEVKASQES